MRLRMHHAAIGAAWTILALGLAALALNVVGLFRDVPVPSGWERTPSSAQQHLVEGDLDRARNETASEYARRLTLSVYYRMTHAWEEGSNPVPATENWILNLLQYSPVRGDALANYEFKDSGRALRRGYGLCSQHALIVADVLERQDLDVEVVGLLGHVVTEATLDGQEFILDADYGVVIPDSVEDVEQDPRSVRRRYRPKLSGAASPFGTSTDVASADLLRTIERVYAVPNEEYGFAPLWAEDAVYVLKWLAPLVALALGAYLLIRRRKARAG